MTRVVTRSFWTTASETLSPTTSKTPSTTSRTSLPTPPLVSGENFGSRSSHRSSTTRLDSRPVDDSEPDSLILLEDGRRIPSVGPGGRIAIESRRGTVLGTASVRPFAENRRVGRWMDVDSVAVALAGFLDVGLEFDPAFGYYEKTWMEHQPVIEPTFAFVIRNDESSEYPSKWEVTVPATVTSDS